MKKILIVDDDQKIASALAIRLKQAEYSVVIAADGLEGLKLAAEHRPDLIILDVWMPNGAGPLIAQRLKHIGLAQVPVVFLTSASKKDLWAIAEDVTPAAYFEKPYDSTELLAAINRIVTGQSADAAA